MKRLVEQMDALIIALQWVDPLGYYFTQIQLVFTHTQTHIHTSTYIVKHKLRKSLASSGKYSGIGGA
jgi:hypothetical protein